MEGESQAIQKPYHRQREDKMTISTKSLIDNETTVYKLPLSDLQIINIYKPDNYSEEANGGESWANAVVNEARFLGAVLYQPDYEGTTDGNQKGINVLILCSDLEVWEKACDSWDAEIEETGLEVTAATYGDSQDSSELLVNAIGDTAYWEITL